MTYDFITSKIVYRPAHQLLLGKGDLRGHIQLNKTFTPLLAALFLFNFQGFDPLGQRGPLLQQAGFH